ncbi:MAG: PQQ-dependent sugar dehydrogenase, partial [Trueperaceae bacterium]
MLKAPALTRKRRLRTLIAPLLTLVVLVACTPPDGQNPPPPPPPPEGELRLEQVTAGLTTPVALTNAGDDRLFVAERAGRVRIIRNGTLLAEPFLDLTASIASSEGEQGLLGLAFPPDHDTSGLFYVYYTA